MIEIWRVHGDSRGGLWLDPGDEDGALIALDARALQTLRAEHGACDRTTTEEKFGPLTELIGGGDQGRGAGR